MNKSLFSNIFIENGDYFLNRCNQPPFFLCIFRKNRFAFPKLHNYYFAEAYRHSKELPTNKASVDRLMGRDEQEKQKETDRQKEQR